MPRIGRKTFVLDGHNALAPPNIGLHTQPVSFVGLPVTAAPTPAGTLLTGIQVIAAPSCKHGR